MNRSALVHRISLEPNPALLEHAQKRAESVQNRIADRITAFAGSMAFVYIHIAWFGSWILFRVEHYPYGLLTMIVSLEAIFLSTFVMISQNRADAKRQVVADLQWQTRPGRGQTKCATARPLQPDPRADESSARLRERTIRHEVAFEATPAEQIPASANAAFPFRSPAIEPAAELEGFSQPNVLELRC
jgi:uncharacterized membrane protein